MKYKGWIILGMGYMCLGVATANIPLLSLRMGVILFSVVLIKLGTVILEK